MKKIFLFLVLLSLNAYSSQNIIESTVVAMVPRGRIVEREGRDFNVKTHAGTKIKVQFLRNGDLDEASGINLNKGDDFEPGHGLVSLGTAAKNLDQLGHKVQGLWKLEKDPELGWIYEINRMTDDEDARAMIDAKTGKVISQKN
jgi:hypothetical protein